ncbi:MAG: TonB-dependent receptor [Hyphomonadaceae bacterium]
MSHRFFRLLGGAALGALALAVPINGAYAQDAEEENVGVGEVIVTAQRREQNLQDVPLSMAAFNAEALTEVGANNIEAINGLVPNVVVEHVGLFPAAASLSMRGVGYAGIESFADPDVAVYINGVYQARNAVALSSTVDVQQIEVLRGPQGTLYGRNAYAGVISLTTNRPEMDEASASAAATLGNYGRVDLEFVGNVPLIENVLAGRIAVRSHRLDGFFENNGIIDAAGTVDQSLEGDPIGREDTLYVRPTLRYTPNNNLTVDFIGEIFRERSEAYPAVGMPAAAPPAAGVNAVGIFANCPTPAVRPQATVCYGARNPFGDESRGLPGDGSDPFSIGTNMGGRPANYDSQVYVLDAAYDLANGRVRAIISHTDVEEEVWADTDGTNQNVFSSARWQDYRAFTAELQYVADWGERLNVVSGITYLADEYNTTQLSFTDFSAPFIGEFTPFSVNPSYINNEGERTAWAAYAQFEYNITDPLSIVLGGRYSWEEKTGYRGENTTLSAAGFAPTIDFSSHPFSTVPGVVFTAPDQSWSNFAPRVGVNYEVSDDMLVYAFWQRAFKSGGFNGNAADRAAFETPYDEQTVDSYEAGFKSEWLDRRLRVNVNFFFAEYQDLQRSAVTPSSTAPSGVVTVTSNAAAVESYGVEIETAMLITPNFTVFANIGYNPSEYSDYCADLDGAGISNTPAPGQVGCAPVTNVDLGPAGPSPEDRFLVPTDNSALRTLRAPEWDITAGGEYAVDLSGGGDLTFNASVNYRSEAWTQLLNVPYSYRRPMTTVDGNIVWEPDGGNFSVTLWGRNLTDEVDVLNYTPVAGQFAFMHPTPPRTYGVTLRADF